MPFSSRYGFEDFVDATHGAASRERLYELLTLAVGSYGFDGLNVSIMQDWQLAPSNTGFGLVNTYPLVWQEEYVEKKLYRLDPVAQCAIGTFGAFQWRDLNRLIGLQANQHAFLRRADRAGLHHGIGLPFSGPGSQIGGIALATSETKLKRPVNLGLLMAFANQFYREYKRIAGIVAIDRPLRVSLSERERQVLTRIGHGRTNHEIGLFLNMKPRTVEFHVRNIFDKLEVTSRAEAVYVALAYGLIQPEPRVFTR
ncbi:helix-turn-helix transcriptional regulator [Asticcacaulis sp.]|uniref:helix-turn-helix transcriptional regulator n=1 Tax=Asticcacaulis sp. TaxID=1872648 RepID=UPI002BE3ECE3|nr:autoinducer binding domain-containing protein [Asticcacaulis sp.]HTM81553.1 autoinducer binding domain-containing protein [Asticcacaulis sp.]